MAGTIKPIDDGVARLTASRRNGSDPGGFGRRFPRTVQERPDRLDYIYSRGK